MSIEAKVARERAVGHHPESPDYKAFISAADRIDLLEAALRVIVDNTVHERSSSLAESVCLIAIQALK